MPNENLDGLEQPPPSEIDRMESDWNAEQHKADRAAREARTQELLESTDRMLEMARQTHEEGQTEPEEAEEATFNEPPPVQAKLASDRADYDSAWEREDSASTPQTPDQIRNKLADEGLRPEPPTAEEAEAAALQEDADKRAEAAAQKGPDKHAGKLHRKRPQRYNSPRDKGAPPNIAREIRGDDL